MISHYPAIIAFLMYLSLGVMTTTALIMFANIKQLGSVEKYGYVTYLISLFFAVTNIKVLEHQFIEMPVFYGLLFISTIVMGTQKLFDYYNIDILHKWVYRKYFRITWSDLVYNRLIDAESYKNVVPIGKDSSENTIIFTLIVNHPTYRQMYYNTFDEILIVNKGVLELKYKGGVTKTLKDGDLLKIERKQVHQFLTKEDCEIKIICIK